MCNFRFVLWTLNRFRHRRQFLLKHCVHDVMGRNATSIRLVVVAGGGLKDKWEFRCQFALCNTLANSIFLFELDSFCVPLPFAIISRLGWFCLRCCCCCCCCYCAIYFCFVSCLFLTKSVTFLVVHHNILTLSFENEFSDFDCQTLNNWIRFNSKLFSIRTII